MRLRIAVCKPIHIQTSYFWYPSIMTVNTPERIQSVIKNSLGQCQLTDKKKFGVSSYAPDLEQKYINDFMARSKGG